MYLLRDTTARFRILLASGATILALCFVAAGVSTHSAFAVPSAQQFFGLSSGGQLGNDAEVAAIRDLGTRRVRNNIAWQSFRNDSNCSPVLSPTFSVSSYDEVVRRAADEEISILAVLYGRGGECDSEFPLPGDPAYAQYQQFVSFVVQRYGVGGSFWATYPGTDQPIQVWEIWNEPNYARNNPGGQTIQSQAYAKFLIDTARTIREAPNIVLSGTAPTILMGGLAPFSAAMAIGEYFGRMYTSPPTGGPSAYTPFELRAAFDGLSWHPYSLTDDSPADVATRVQGHIDNARDVLDAERPSLGGGSNSNKSLWLTELGWPVMTTATGVDPNYSVGPENQAHYLWKTFPWIRSNADALNIKYVAWYYYQDQFQSCSNWECWDRVAGLRDASGNPRPSWCAYSHAIGTNLCEYIPPGGFDTETFATVRGWQHGTPGSVTVDGHVNVTNMPGQKVNGVVVELDFSRWENGDWRYRKTARPSVANGYYRVTTQVGAGQWRVKAVFPKQGAYNRSETQNYHGFEIKPTAGASQSFPSAPDVFAFGLNETASGMLEVHSLDADTGYWNFNLHAASALHSVSPSSWEFDVADYNGDGKMDVVATAANTTGSGKTEVHVLNGATNFSTYLLHAVTGLHQVGLDSWEFEIGDYNRDGVQDLYAIVHGGSGSGRTEVHVLNGATSYSTFLLHAVTPLHPVASGSWEFAVGNYDGDNKLDVYAIAGNTTGSGMTEIHVMSSTTNYSTWSLHAVSALHSVSLAEFTFGVGDFNRDNRGDVYVIRGANTSSGMTEIHVLESQTNYSTYSLHAVSGLHPLSFNSWKFAIGW